MSAAQLARLSGNGEADKWPIGKEGGPARNMPDWGGMPRMRPIEWNDQLLRDVVEWDVSTWRKAVWYWDRFVDERLPLAEPSLLEIGARGGGVTLMFALKGFACTCTDKGESFEQARALHRARGVAGLVTYADADALALPFADESFDVVVFKSVLGAIGRSGHGERMEAAVAEVLRVLKPGGTLLFAENLQGTWLHRALRRRFKRWGTSWNYPTPERMRGLLAGFSRVELHTYGCFGCLWRDHLLTRKADELLCRRDPSPRHYMCYGAAVKG